MTAGVGAVLSLLGLGAVLLVSGFYGRRHAATLGFVHGMPAADQQHRIAVLRRGATTCAVVGVALLVLGVVAPFL